MNDMIHAFVLESRRNLSEYDKCQFKNSYSVITEGGPLFMFDVGGIVKKSVDNDIAYVLRAVEYLEAVGELDFISMSNFFSQVYSSLPDTSKYKIVLMNDEEIEKIRPDYLGNVCTDFDSWASQILSGQKKASDVRDAFIDDKYFDRLKKQLVKTTLTADKLKDLMKWTVYLPVSANKDCIRNSILPFLSEAPQSIKDLKSMANHVVNTLSSTCRCIMDTHNSIVSTINSMSLSTDTAKTMRYFDYNFLRRYLNLCSFLTGMCIHKIAYMNFNAKSIVKLQNEIRDTANIQLTENVAYGTIDGIKDEDLLNSIINKGFDLVLPCIHSAIERKRVEIVNTVNNIVGYNVDLSRSADTDRYPYDSSAYKIIDDMVRIVLDGLKEITVNASDPDSTLDEVVCCAKLDKFPAMFSNTLRNKIPDVSFYTCQMDSDAEVEDKEVTMCVYSELTEFEFLASHVSSSLRSGYQEIELLIGSFAIDGHGLDPVTHSELKKFLDNLRTSYTDFVISAARALIQRVNNLIDIFNSKDEAPNDLPNISSIPKSPLDSIDTPYPYSFDAYESEYADIEWEEKQFFENGLREYNALVNKRDRGVIIAYEDNPPENNTATSDKNNSSQPSVSGDAQEQHAQKDGNDQNSDTSSNNDTSNKQSLIDRFKDWIQRILDKFRNKAQKMTKRNNAWLTRVKSDVLGLDFTNITIHIAPYKNSDTQAIIADANAAASKIQTLNAKSLPEDIKSGQDKAAKYIFPHIPDKAGKSGEFGSRVSHFMVYGNGNDNGSLVTYSGDGAKNKVTSMISFCETYDKTYKSVSNSLDNLSKAAINKQSEIISNMGSSTNESVLTEANSVSVDGKRTTGENESTVSSSSILTSLARTYTGQVLTVVEKQYLDYIKVLDKLAPSKKDNEEPAKSQNDAETTKDNGDKGTEDSSSDEN